VCCSSCCRVRKVSVRFLRWRLVLRLSCLSLTLTAGMVVMLWLAWQSTRCYHDPTEVRPPPTFRLPRIPWSIFTRFVPNFIQPSTWR
jgi:hypothetical protein